MSLHTLKMNKTLYYLGANNKLYSWSIATEGNVIEIEHGTLQGEKTKTYEEIKAGKAGRSIYSQLILRVESRINKQKLQGYKESIDEAQLGRTNVLNLPKPMLAQPLSRVRNVVYENCYIQYKYDGNRCLITKQNGVVLAYSRKGKLIESISHILKDLTIPEGLTIDGELYCHGVPLQTIRSWVSRKQKDTLKLRYHAYDVIIPLKYSQRLKMLESLVLNENIEVVPTYKWSDLKNPNLKHLLNWAMQEGYEGLILRTDTSGYEVGKRSKTLIKVKSFLDAEFIVEKIFLSDKGRPVARCQIDENNTFDVVLPGSLDDKMTQYRNKDYYEGKELTVEFSQWTKDNIPFHPVARCWRNI